MPKYMLILGGTDKAKVIANRDIAMKKYGEWTEQLIKENRLASAHKLKDQEGRRLNVRDNAIVDGPFSETKETIGGYYIVEAKDYNEAVTIAKNCPVLLYQGGYVEIREVER